MTVRRTAVFAMRKMHTLTRFFVVFLGVWAGKPVYFTQGPQRDTGYE
jgi:hypothetical protein